MISLIEGEIAIVELVREAFTTKKETLIYQDGYIAALKWVIKQLPEEG